MTEFWCPIAQVKAEFYGKGVPIDGMTEFNQMDHCRGCAEYPAFTQQHVYLSILVSKNEVVSCIETTEE